LNFSKPPESGAVAMHGRRSRFVPSRRLAISAGALALLITAGTAIARTAIPNNIDFLGHQAEIDASQYTPPELKAVGPRNEVARGADWSFMVWRSSDGFCVAYAAREANASGRACGQLPDSGSKSRYVVATLMTTNRASDGLGALVGLVTSPVARVDIELSNGR